MILFHSWGFWNVRKRAKMVFVIYGKHPPAEQISHGPHHYICGADIILDCCHSFLSMPRFPGRWWNEKILYKDYNVDCDGDKYQRSCRTRFCAYSFFPSESALADLAYRDGAS